MATYCQRVSLALPNLVFSIANSHYLAFVFPPRTPNNRGPMIWNDQLLTFAGVRVLYRSFNPSANDANSTN